MSLHEARVAVTRAPDQELELRRLLEAAGARVSAFPLIRVRAAADTERVAATVRAGDYDWAVFTSANGVRFSEAALQAHGGPTLADALRGARVACVGPATAQAAIAAGLDVAVMPDRHVGAALADAMAGAGALAGRHVLWPRAQGARDTVRASLEAAGARVSAPVVYGTVPDDAAAHALAGTVLQGGLDIVTFTSPSCVRSLAAVLPRWPAGVSVGVIGPVTAAAARAVGYRVDAVAAEPTAAGLVRALMG